MATRRADIELRRNGRLADGMEIVAKVRARLLGMKLLDLDANVTVTPVAPYVSVHSRRARSERLGRAALGRAEANGHGPIGDGLEGAARSLEGTIAELDEVRRRMPEGPPV
jgi:hypothetical protein